MKRVVWLLQTAVFYCFTWLVALMPERMSERVGTGLGLLMRRVLGKRRRIAEDNIARTLVYMRSQPGWNCTIPDAEGIARETFRNIGRALVEVCRLYHGHGVALINRTELRGKEHYDAARSKGKGMILLTAHCGNWELMALSHAQLLGSTMSVVARRQNNPYLNAMVEKMRMSYDNRVIYKDNALKNMLSVLRQQGTVGLLVDQAVFPEEGCLISFLGRPAWASKAPVLLARKTGIPVVPAFIHYTGDHYLIDLFPELVFSGDKSEEGWRADVQTYSSAIERFIIQHPTSWYWVHRRWKRAGEPAT
ncbi:MAG: lysophospholipid acyltransferase family protein [Geobacter sp.]|nr:lysophospholipid acyltransferase family protein [Geobacter sp.]